MACTNNFDVNFDFYASDIAFHYSFSRVSPTNNVSVLQRSINNLQLKGRFTELLQLNVFSKKNLASFRYSNASNVNTCCCAGIDTKNCQGAFHVKSTRKITPTYAKKQSKMHMTHCFCRVPRRRSSSLSAWNTHWKNCSKYIMGKTYISILTCLTLCCTKHTLSVLKT